MNGKARKNKKASNLFGALSDESSDTQEFKVCPVGQLKHKFIMQINVDTEDVASTKWNILKKLDYLGEIDKEYKKETKEKSAWANESFSTGQL